MRSPSTSSRALGRTEGLRRERRSASRRSGISARAALLATVLFVAGSPLQARPPDPGARTCVALERLKAAGDLLSDVPVEGDAADSGRLEWPVPDLLTETKSALRELVLAVVDELSGPALEPARLQAILAARLAGEGLAVDPLGGHVGTIAELSITRPPSNPDLLAVVSTLLVPCGSDSSLLLLERRGRGYETALVAEEGAFDEVSGAAWSLQWAVSPRLEDGRWFLVTTQLTPWCTSNWRGRRTRLLLPGGSPEDAVVALDRDDFVYIGMDTDVPIEIDAAGFRYACAVTHGLDDARFVRNRILSYRLDGQVARRVAPIAEDPVDFLDEWRQLPPEEAALWVTETARGAALAFHEESFRTRRDVQASVGEVLECPEADGCWRIGVDLEPRAVEGGSAQPDATRVWVGVVKRDGAFLVSGVEGSLEAGRVGGLVPLSRGGPGAC